MSRSKSFFFYVVFMFSFSLFGQSKPEVFSTEDGAIRGYDPVAFFTQSKAIKGNKDMTLEWNNATWHFASKENLDSFKRSPEKYAPQFGGYCAFGMSRGYKAPTEADTWTIVDGLLYFNYNLEVKGKWTQDQKGYIEKANKNWPEAKKN